jgi:outer membrane protein assembly factor BamB
MIELLRIIFLKMRYIITLFLFLIPLITSEAQIGNDDWPLFRGRADLAGKIESELPASPKLLWSIKTGGTTKSSPVISEGNVYFGNDKGSLVAVSSNGSLKWKYESGSSIDAAPMVFGNKVIFGAGDGILRAVDKNSGKLIWSYTTDNQIAGSANVWVAGNKAGIVAGSYDYFLHCVNPETGKVMWKIETENYINGTPAILNGKIVFGGCDGMIRIVDPLTGKQKDTVNIGVYIASSPALAGDMAYFGDYDGTKYGVNINTKRIVWKIPGSEEGGAILAIPAVGNNSVVIGSEDKYLYCYNSFDGKLLWKYRTNGRIIGSAVLSPTNVLFTGMDGYVYILGLANGKKLWSFNAGSPIGSSPAVIKGKFFILTEDGRLLAFGNE